MKGEIYLIKVNGSINKKAVLTHGITVQSVVCMEELAELQKEISKFIRGSGDRVHLTEEIADVYICLDMLQRMYNVDTEQLQDEIFCKQNRTLKRLEGIRYGHLETDCDKRPEQVRKP